MTLSLFIGDFLEVLILPGFLGKVMGWFYSFVHTVGEEALSLLTTVLMMLVQTSEPHGGIRAVHWNQGTVPTQALSSLKCI